MYLAWALSEFMIDEYYQRRAAGEKLTLRKLSQETVVFTLKDLRNANRRYDRMHGCPSHLTPCARSR